EAHFGVPWAGSILVAINTRLAADEVSYILEHSGASVLVVDPSLVELVEDTTPARARVRRGVRGLSRLCSVRRAGGPARRRGRHDLDQLHERDDRAAEGCDVHAPRRLPQRAGGGAARGARLELGLPLDAADVPLQRLVLPVGGNCAWRHACLPAQGRSP